MIASFPPNNILKPHFKKNFSENVFDQFLWWTNTCGRIWLGWMTNIQKSLWMSLSERRLVKLLTFWLRRQNCSKSTTKPKWSRRNITNLFVLFVTLFSTEPFESNFQLPDLRFGIRLSTWSLELRSILKSRTELSKTWSPKTNIWTTVKFFNHCELELHETVNLLNECDLVSVNFANFWNGEPVWSKVGNWEIKEVRNWKVRNWEFNDITNFLDLKLELNSKWGDDGF